MALPSHHVHFYTVNNFAIVLIFRTPLILERSMKN